MPINILGVNIRAVGTSTPEFTPGQMVQDRGSEYVYALAAALQSNSATCSLTVSADQYLAVGAASPGFRAFVLQATTTVQASTFNWYRLNELAISASASSNANVVGPLANHV